MNIHRRKANLYYARFAKVLALCVILLTALGSGSSYSAQPTGQKKILVLPFYIAPDGSQRELQEFGDHVNKRVRSAIELLGDAYILESRQFTEKLLAGQPAVENDGRAQQIASRAGADLVIYGSLSTTGTLFHMRGVVWDLAKGRESVATDIKVGNIHELPGVLELFIRTINTRLLGSPNLPLYRTDPGSGPGIAGAGRPQSLVSIPRDTGPWRSPEIGAAIWSLAIGDLDGDGRNEIVFLQETGMTISSFEGGSLKTLAQISQAPVRYISAEVADIDGDGIAELIVCYLTPSGLESAVIKYKNRVFEVSQKFPEIILRMVAESSGDKRSLVGQRTDVTELFSGELVRFQAVDGRIVPTGAVSFPPGALLLSQAAGELGKNKKFLRVILNQDQRLLVFDSENRLVAQVSDRIYGLDRRLRIPSPTGYRDVIFPGSLLIADTDGDGENELLLIREGGGGSSIQALVWEGDQLVEKWKTVRTPGLISDFSIGDLKNDKIRSLVLILLKPTPFPAVTGSRSIVFAYDLMP